MDIMLSGGGPIGSQMETLPLSSWGYGQVEEIDFNQRILQAAMK